jgi:hypothetical protein
MADATLGPLDIWKSLRSAGRTEGIRKVTTILNHFVQRGLLSQFDRAWRLAEWGNRPSIEYGFGAEGSLTRTATRESQSGVIELL